MMRHELRRYITYGQLIMWPRIVISARNHVKLVLFSNAISKGDVRSIRCTMVRILRQELIAQ
ncbi:hypothetical protein [Vulcanisaeta moutnovskia]|nr:hypothetical protein [Vulcanisaeta moutnovskia]